MNTVYLISAVKILRPLDGDYFLGSYVNGGMILLVGFSCNSAILSHLEGGEGPDQPQSECPVGTTGTVSPEPTSDCGRPPPRVPSRPAGLLPGLQVRRRGSHPAASVLHEGRERSGRGCCGVPGSPPQLTKDKGL